MSPVVKIDYDSGKFQLEFIKELACELHTIVSKASGLPLDDVSVFANENQITVNAAPVEIYINADSGAIPNQDKETMLKIISYAVKKFKESKNISVPVNISVVEMHWKVGVGI